MSQTATRPTVIEIPQPPSQPDTPSEVPGTPTSTTTSLSALSTTAIKDGHRGHALPTTTHRGGGHQHHSSTNSLEAERADRISRLAGLGTMSSLRPPHSGHGHSSHTSPLPTGFVSSAHAMAGLTPAYFDAHGQPTAATKISTVGTASATESVGGRTLGEGDQDMMDRDEDLLSMDTNYRETELDSTSGYLVGGTAPGEMDTMEDLTSRSVGGYDDRMSDDGSASLVGFGEGAGSTVSGPIYHRRPLPVGSSAGNFAQLAHGLERTGSGLSESAMANSRRTGAANDKEAGSGFGGGGDTPTSISALNERREARMVDGISTDGAGISAADAGDDVFVDTTTQGALPIGGVIQPTTSAIRETQVPQSHQHRVQLEQDANNPTTLSRDAERIVQRLADSEERADGHALGTPGQADEPLGKFYFEQKK